jgi:hypothetical protein
LRELFQTTDELIAILERPKRIVTPVVWTPPDLRVGQRQLKLKASLVAQEATILGVRIEVSCHAESFDLPSHVVLLVDYGGKPRAMARIDINGSGHPNAFPEAGALFQSDAGPTHFHDTRLHRRIPIRELFTRAWDLPVAMPISDMPTEFQAAMEKCSELLHIENLGEISEPPWQPRQLPF